MNKTVIGGIIGVVVLGAIAVVAANMFTSSDKEPVVVDSPNSITRPAVQAIPNTFSIMTPEEKAAADEAQRLAAEEALKAELASSTASSSDETESEEETTE